MVNRKNILVTGANGQLGISIKEVSNDYNHNFYFKEKKDLDITNFITFKKFLKKIILIQLLIVQLTRMLLRPNKI